MARKKLSKDLKPQQPQEPLSADEKQSKSHEVQNLKTLNLMLAKETIEKRFQIESLKSEIEKLEMEKPLLFDIEHGIYRLVVSAAVSEEKERGIGKAEDSVKEITELKEEIVRLRDAEKRNGVLEGDFGRLKKERDELKEGMAKLEKRSGEVEGVVADLEKERAEKEMMVARVMEVKADQEVEIDRLKEEMGKLNLSLSSLSEVLQKSGELEGVISRLDANVAVLENQEDCMEKMLAAIMQEKVDQEAVILHLNEELTALNSRLLVLREVEKKNEELERDISRLVANVNGLEKEKEEKEMMIAALLQEKAEHEAKILQLKELVANQDALQRELDCEKEDAGCLKMQLDKVTNCRDALVSEKALLEKSLSATEAKMSAAELTSSKTLSLLKRTVDSMNGSEFPREISATDDDDENIRPFVGQLESIKTAHYKKLSEMSWEISEAKKRRGLWMWLYPVTATFIAALSIAYATKGR